MIFVLQRLSNYQYYITGHICQTLTFTQSYRLPRVLQGGNNSGGGLTCCVAKEPVSKVQSEEWVISPLQLVWGYLCFEEVLQSMSDFVLYPKLQGGNDSIVEGLLAMQQRNQFLEQDGGSRTRCTPPQGGCTMLSSRSTQVTHSGKRDQAVKLSIHVL